MKKELEGTKKEIWYIGKDLVFWKKLIKKFTSLWPSEEFEFYDLFHKTHNKFKTIFPTVVRFPPDILFIDHSKKPQETMRLTLGVKNEISTRNMTVIGLFNNLDSKEILRTGLSVGSSINIVKSIEMSSMVQNALSLTYPNAPQMVKFATIKTDLPVVGTTFFKIGYLTCDYIHIESNHIFEQNELVHLKTNIFNDIELTDNYTVIASGQNDLYSTYKNWYDLKFENYSDLEILKLTKEFELAEDDEEKEKIKIRIKHSEKIAKEEAKLRHNKIIEWIELNQRFSRPKRTKLLVIDHEMSILFQTEKFLDSFPYAIRHHSLIDEDASIIENVYSEIIVFNYQEEINNITALERIITKIKTLKDYKPILLVFNYLENCESLKQKLNYNKIIIQSDKIDLEVIHKLVDTFEKKWVSSSSKKEDDRIYLSKYDEKSIAEYAYPLTIKTISEMNVTFSSETNIPLYTGFYVKFPTKMTLTVVPSKEKGSSLYNSIVNGVDEIGNKHFRKFLNDLFFQEKEKKEKAKGQKKK